MTTYAWRRWLLAICAATLVGIAAIRYGVANIAAGHSGSATQTANLAARWSAAQRIELDPATGLVRERDAATPRDVINALSYDAIPVTQSANLTARDMDEVHLPDGTVGVRLARRFYHTISVCLQADGSFSSACPAAKP